MATWRRKKISFWYSAILSLYRNRLGFIIGYPLFKLHDYTIKIWDIGRVFTINLVSVSVLCTNWTERHRSTYKYRKKKWVTNSKGAPRNLRKILTTYILGRYQIYCVSFNLLNIRYQIFIAILMRLFYVNQLNADAYKN